MLPCLFVDIPFSKAEVNYVKILLCRTKAHHEVVGLNVPVQVLVIVQQLDASQDLFGQHADGLQVELLFAGLEQGF